VLILIRVRTLRGRLGKLPRAARLAKWIPASPLRLPHMETAAGRGNAVGFLTCLAASCSLWLDCRGALGDAMVASHGLRFVLPRMLASLSEATDASRGVLAMCVHTITSRKFTVITSLLFYKCIKLVRPPINFRPSHFKGSHS
jgi:hypothetical protein